MNIKRLLALVLIVVLGVICCACDGNTDGATSSSGTNNGNTNGTTVSADASNEPLTDATLTVKIKKGEVTKFKSNRPYDKKKEDISLILVTGQSNFTPNVGFATEYAGFASGKIDKISEPPVIPLEGTCYSSANRSSITSLSAKRDMANLCNSTNPANTLGGVTPSFGIKWNELTGTKVVFIQAAVGAVGIHEWTPNSGEYICECNENANLYQWTVDIFKQSYEELSKDYNIVYMGYIWNQGEHEEVYGKADCESTVHSDKTYYDAFKSIHDGFMRDLGLDFGGISVVRADKAGSSAQSSMNLTIARSAQYKLCNDIDNLFMISTMGETCDKSVMDQTNTIHYSQMIFNRMGADCANNLYKCLGLSDEMAQFSGIEVYSSTAYKLMSFDKDGKTDGGSVVAKSYFTDHILAKLCTLGTNYKINGFSLVSADGTDLSQYIDEFGAIYWKSIATSKEIKTINIKCVIE